MTAASLQLVWPFGPVHTHSLVPAFTTMFLSSVSDRAVAAGDDLLISKRAVLSGP